MLNDGIDKFEFRNSFSKFFAIRIVRKRNKIAVIVQDSFVRDRRVSGISGDIT